MKRDTRIRKWKSDEGSRTKKRNERVERGDLDVETIKDPGELEVQLLRRTNTNHKRLKQGRKGRRERPQEKA